MKFPPVVAGKGPTGGSASVGVSSTLWKRREPLDRDDTLRSMANNSSSSAAPPRSPVKVDSCLKLLPLVVVLLLVVSWGTGSDDEGATGVMALACPRFQGGGCSLLGAGVARGGAMGAGAGGATGDSSSTSANRSVLLDFAETPRSKANNSSSSAAPPRSPEKVDSCLKLLLLVVVLLVLLMVTGGAGAGVEGATGVVMALACPRFQGGSASLLGAGVRGGAMSAGAGGAAGDSSSTSTSANRSALLEFAETPRRRANNSASSADPPRSPVKVDGCLKFPCARGSVGAVTTGLPTLWTVMGGEGVEATSMGLISGFFSPWIRLVFLQGLLSFAAVVMEVLDGKDGVTVGESIGLLLLS